MVKITLPHLNLSFVCDCWVVTGVLVLYVVLWGGLVMSLGVAAALSSARVFIILKVSI